MMKKILVIIIMLSLLSVMLVSGEDDQTTNLQEIEYKKLLLEQHAKTQAEFKQELAKRDAQLETKVVSMVDENFRVLDERIDGFIRKAVFKLGMAIFSAIVLSGSVLMLINNQLKRKRAIKKKLVNHNEEMTLSGGTLHAIKEANTPLEQEMSTAPTPTKKTRGRPRKTTAEQQVEKKPETITKSLKSRTIEPLGDEL